MRSVPIVLALLFSAASSFSQTASEICEGVLVHFRAEGDSVTVTVLAPAANLLGCSDHHSMGLIEILDAAADTVVDDTPFTEFGASELQDLLCLRLTVPGKKEGYYVRFSFRYSGGAYVLEIRCDGKRSLELAEQN